MAKNSSSPSPKEDQGGPYGHVEVPYPTAEQGLHSIQHIIGAGLGREEVAVPELVAHGWIGTGATLSQVLPLAGPMHSTTLSNEQRETLEELQACCKDAEGMSADLDSWKKRGKLLLTLLLQFLGCIMLLLVLSSGEATASAPQAPTPPQDMLTGVPPTSIPPTCCVESMCDCGVTGVCPCGPNCGCGPYGKGTAPDGLEYICSKSKKQAQVQTVRHGTTVTTTFYNYGSKRPNENAQKVPVPVPQSVTPKAQKPPASTLPPPPQAPRTAPAMMVVQGPPVMVVQRKGLFGLRKKVTLVQPPPAAVRVETIVVNGKRLTVPAGSAHSSGACGTSMMGAGACGSGGCGSMGAGSCGSMGGSCGSMGGGCGSMSKMGGSMMMRRGPMMGAPRMMMARRGGRGGC